MRRNQLRLVVLTGVLWLVAGIGVVWLQAAPLASWLDAQAEDAYFQLRGSRAPSGKVVLVALDEQSYARLPLSTTYWGGYYAEVVKRLASTGAQVIAFDVFFAPLPELDAGATETELELKSQEHAQYTTFGAAMAEARFVYDCPVLLASYLVDGRLNPPRNELIAGAGGGFETLGAVNLPTSESRDEVVREFGLWWPAADGTDRAILSLPYLAAYYAQGNKLGLSRYPKQEPRRLRINFAGPKGSMPRIPFTDLLFASPEELTELSTQWQDSIVFIGSTGLPEDIHLTPYSRAWWRPGSSPELMPGVELLANVAETVMGGSAIHEVAPGWIIGLGLPILLLSACVNIWFGVWARTGIDLLLACVVAGTGYVFFLQNYLLPAGTLLLALIIFSIAVRGARFALVEREHARLSDYFGRYTSPNALTRILNDQHRALLEGERCQVAVMFADIRGFTTMSEGREPQVVIRFLTRFQDQVAAVVAEYGGWIDKFLGDGALVLFGYPQRLPDAAQHATECGLAMIKAAGELQPLGGEGQLSIGVGLHFGPVVVGNVGSKTKLDFTTVGDTVNAAARVQDLCKKYQKPFLLTAAVVEQLDTHTLELESLGLAQIRGRSAVELYACHGYKPLKETDSAKTD